MDCNKDEASRAMLIAEQKLKDNDIAGAKRFAYKAKSMCHDLDGIEQMICTIDVLLVLAQTESDEYEILSVDRSADPIALRKRYMKLVLQLHPDKNKLSGANVAFDAVYNAYKKLCEKAELKGHSTSTGEYQQSSSKAAASNPAPCSEGESHSFEANAASEPGKKQEAGSATNASSDPPAKSNPGVKKSAATHSSTVGEKKQKSGASSAPPVFRRHVDVHRTFWTLCANCNIKFKYPTIFRNHTIKCKTCHHPYEATEIPEPIRN